MAIAVQPAAFCSDAGSVQTVQLEAEDQACFEDLY